MIQLATSKRQFTLRVQPDIFEKMKYISELEHRSLAMQIEYLMKKNIEDYEKEHDTILLPNSSQ